MKFNLFNRADYFRSLTRDIHESQRGDRVLVATMPIDTNEPFIADLLAALRSAASKGAHVTLIIDAITFMLVSQSKVPGPLWYHQTLPDNITEPFKTYRTVLETLEAHGVHVTITNIPRTSFSLPFAGRSHIKAGIVNNKVYLGGCNLDDHKKIDIMAATTNKVMADWLYDQLAVLALEANNTTAFNGIDQTFSVSAHAQLIIDAGKQNQSAILEAAYDVIESAQESLFMTCQFSPGGQTAQRLLAAHKRGVDVQIYYSPASTHGFLAPGHALYELREKYRLPKSFFTFKLPRRAPQLHAKILASEKEVMFGSHNFVTQGISLGTAEIALRVTDPELAEETRVFIRKQLEPYY